MKNLSNFRSFVQNLNEGVQDWDPKRAQSAIDELRKNTKDSQPTSLTFDNIKKVFGDISFNNRYMIAWALKLAGKDFFPTSEEFPTPEKVKEHFGNTTLSMYQGNADQNKKMNSFSEALLKAIKPLYDDLKSTEDQDRLIWGNPIESAKRDSVKRAKAAISNINA